MIAGGGEEVPKWIVGPPPDPCLSPNALVRALPPDHRAALVAASKRSLVSCGELSGVPTAFFPETAILSLIDARGVELALVGREGMTGWSILLGSMTHGVRCIAECSGTVLALPLFELTRLCRASAPIRAMVLQFVEVVAAQMVHAISAATHRSLTARLSRRLLMLHDRGLGDSFDVTHARLAEALAVRRASVTDRLHLLEGERILRCTRNRVTVLDRPALLAAADEAYGGAELAYREIIGAFGKS